VSESTGTEETFSAETLEKMAAKIRALLAKAESTKFPEEAAAYHAKAEELRRRYQIAEEGLIAQDPFSIAPIVRDITITDDGSDFYMHHVSLWAHCCAHVGAFYQARWVGRGIVARVVGYASDIRLAEGLYQSAWLTMIAQLEPKVDPDLSDKENVYRLRNAGFERNDIACMLWESPKGKGGHAAHAKVGKLYAEACREKGEQPLVAGKGINKMVYRERYADGFVTRFYARLNAARDAVDSVHGALTLHGREQRVKEAFWTEFPEQHPEARKAAAERRRAEAEANPVAAKERKWTKADQTRYERNHRSAAALAGDRAGRLAADKVEISRTTEPAKRVEESKPAPGGAIALGG